VSYRSRDYVPPDGVMFRAVGYDSAGRAVAAAGPYATRGPATARRAAMWHRRGVVRVAVEVCRPAWETVPGTEIPADG